MNTAEKLTAIAENVSKVYDAGKKSEYDMFWDSYQSEGNRKNYNSFFQRGGWKNGTTYNPKYPMECTANGYATNMYSYTGISDTVVPIIISGSHAGVFYEAEALVTITLLRLSGVTGSMADWFTGCDNLENVTIEGEIPVSVKFTDSKKLNARSLESIVTKLSDTASGKSATFSAAAINKADWSTTNYASWDALVAQKPNWTFTLV